jgi:hypothetical protein
MPRDLQPLQFPYIKFRQRYYPLIPIALSNGTHFVNTYALIDSGASTSVFRPEIAKALRVSPKKKDIFRLATASGGVHILQAKVGVQIADIKFNTAIGFSAVPATEFNIIGREGFFDRFTICFNEAAKVVVMLPLS